MTVKEFSGFKIVKAEYKFYLLLLRTRCIKFNIFILVKKLEILSEENNKIVEKDGIKKQMVKINFKDIKTKNTCLKVFEITYFIRIQRKQL